MELSFKRNREIKTFSNAKFRELVVSRLALKEILIEVL
jgi:hypothetical protein